MGKILKLVGATIIVLVHETVRVMNIGMCIATQNRCQLRYNNSHREWGMEVIHVTCSTHGSRLNLLVHIYVVICAFCFF